MNKPRKVEPIHVEGVTLLDRKRDVKPEAVKVLAESIKSVGLRTPITVRVVDEGQFLHLVTGAHRLAAAKLLGWEMIDAFIEEEEDYSEIDAELWEIAENLHRADLSALERDEQVARWVVLVEERVQSSQAVTIESKRVDGKGHRPESGVRAAARELDVNRMDAYRATKVAGLSDQAKETAREVGLDNNRTALLAAARQSTPEAQASYLQKQADQKTSNHERAAIDKQIALSQAEQFADWLVSRIDPCETNTLIAWLEGCRPGEVIKAIRRQTA